MPDRLFRLLPYILESFPLAEQAAPGIPASLRGNTPSEEYPVRRIFPRTPRPFSVVSRHARPQQSATAVLFEAVEGRRLMAVSVDASGWTNVTPAADSRIVYVSSSEGVDTNDGLSPASPVKTIAKGKTLLRTNSADWLLLKRGDTWYERYGQLGITGRSKQEPILISAYGDGDRPLLKTRSDSAITTNITPVKNVSIIGIHFNSNTNDPQSPDFTNSAGAYGFHGAAPVSGLLIEDCLFEHYGTNLLFQATQGPVTDVAVRRSVILDATGGAQGAYVNGVDGLLLEDNLFDHNGWSEENAGEPANIYDHNVYMSSKNSGVVVRGNIFSNASSHGLQARSGGIVENNLFLKNPIGMVFGNGSTFKEGGVEGRVADNVFIDSRDINGQPRGYAVEVGNTKPGAGTTLEGNIFAHDGQRNHPAIKLAMGSAPGNLQDAVGLNDLTITDNIVYDWYQAISTDSGYVPGASGYKALNGLVVRDNDFQQTISSRLALHGNPFDPSVENWHENHYWDDSPSSGWFTLGSTPASFDQWQDTLEPNANRTQRKYLDPDRTVATYVRSLGGDATSQAFIDAARGQSRQNWRPQLTADAFNDYMRDGFTVDTAVPVAGLEAADVNALGGAGHAFIVHYADDHGIDPRTLDSDDLRVTGPNGYDRLATLVGVDRAGTTTRAAVYSVAAPDGGWSEADAGLYTVTARSGQVTDFRGNSLRAGVIGTFWVRSDTEAPTASGAALPVTTAGGVTHTVTVTYADNHEIDASSLGTGDLLVTGPNGYEQIATLVGVDAAGDGTPRVATYRFDAPGGTWDAADSGTYTVTLLPDQVRDTSGNFHAGGAVAEFTVAVEGAPAVTTRVSAASVTSTGTSRYAFTIASDSLENDGDASGGTAVQVTGPSGYNQIATVESISYGSGGGVKVVSYSVAPHAGVWDAGDNGRYTIRRVSAAVAAQAEPGVALPPGEALGSFSVAIARSDYTPPTVVAAAFSATFDDKVVLRFSEDVSASLAAGDFEVTRVGREQFAPSRLRLGYDRRYNRATVTFDGYGSGELGAGLYRLVLRANGVTDGAGNRLDGNKDGAAGGNLVLYFRKS